MRKIVIIMLLNSLLLYCCKTQEAALIAAKANSPIKLKGYIINLYGENGVWVFQPCNNKNITVIGALDSQSFFVQDMINDLGYNLLSEARSIGLNSIPVNVYDISNHLEVNDTMQYMFCNVTINPLSNYKRLAECAYIILDNGNKSKFVCGAMENYVTELEPLNTDMRKKFLKYYSEHNVKLPDWSK